MLTSITPLGERGRGQRWGITATALMTGHVVGGMALGGVLAGASAAVDLLVGRPGTGIAAVAGVSAVAVAGDLAGARLPGRRQVDERWLNTYRGWVYGLGFGAQLGFGFVTVVNTLLFVAVVVAAPLVGPDAAFTVGVVYGAGRGVMALLGARVRSTGQLRELHRRLDGLDPTVQAVSSGLVVAAGVLALVA